MATSNVTKKNVVEQLRNNTRLLHAETEDQLRNYAIFCHRVSALPILSGTLAVQVADGEPYELIARGVAQLHLNISEMAEQAEQLCQQFSCGS